MADSNITKRALANSLKSLMSQQPFSKISIGDICDKCEMNRKSLYYHFRDKYDLVNWTFENEFVAYIRCKKCDTVWDVFDELCYYLYDNRTFYRNAFEVDGQNSFSEYFLNFAQNLFADWFAKSSDDAELIEFQASLMSQATKSVIHNWLMNKESINPQEFSSKVKQSTLNIALHLTNDCK